MRRCWKIAARVFLGDIPTDRRKPRSRKGTSGGARIRKEEATGGIVYHVLNRAVGKLKRLKQDDDYAVFERVLEEACERTETCLLSYCLMPRERDLTVRSGTRWNAG